VHLESTTGSRECRVDLATPASRPDDGSTSCESTSALFHTRPEVRTEQPAASAAPDSFVRQHAVVVGRHVASTDARDRGEPAGDHPDAVAENFLPAIYFGCVTSVSWWSAPEAGYVDVRRIQPRLPARRHPSANDRVRSRTIRSCARSPGRAVEPSCRGWFRRANAPGKKHGLPAALEPIAH
jgi:hypothetical protein